MNIVMSKLIPFLGLLIASYFSVFNQEFIPLVVLGISLIWAEKMDFSLKSILGSLFLILSMRFINDNVFISYALFEVSILLFLGLKGIQKVVLSLVPILLIFLILFSNFNSILTYQNEFFLTFLVSIRFLLFLLDRNESLKIWPLYFCFSLIFSKLWSFPEGYLIIGAVGVLVFECGLELFKFKKRDPSVFYLIAYMILFTYFKASLPVFIIYLYTQLLGEKIKLRKDFSRVELLVFVSSFGFVLEYMLNTSSVTLGVVLITTLVLSTFGYTLSNLKNIRINENSERKNLMNVLLLTSGVVVLAIG